VTAVSAVASAASGVASYPVTVSFTDGTGTFNAGATAQADVTVATVDNVVEVPALAVTSSGTNATVTVRTEAGDTTRPVTTGLTSGGMVQITGGLQAGEQVVVAVPARNGRIGGAGFGGGGTGGSGSGPTTGTGTGTERPATGNGAN
jgi:multidrug efflux pump subunit AcrA (membrane-fusion protein)